MGKKCALDIAPTTEFGDLLKLCESLEEYLNWKHEDCHRDIPRIPRLLKQCKRTHKRFNAKYPEVPTYSAEDSEE